MKFSITSGSSILFILFILSKNSVPKLTNEQSEHKKSGPRLYRHREMAIESSVTLVLSQNSVPKFANVTFFLHWLTPMPA